MTEFLSYVFYFVAAIFLKEREEIPRKIIGSLVALAGLSLMT